MIEPEINFHVLRHTYGSLLASKGVPLQVIAELLGHSDTRITSQHYAHLMPSFVSDTLRRICRILVRLEMILLLLVMESKFIYVDSLQYIYAKQNRKIHP